MENARPQHFDAIVVLANLMDAQGNLNEESQERVRTAADGLGKALAPVMVTCGWAYRDDSSLAIADAMANYAVDKLGVHRDRILCDRNSRDTVGDAVFTKRNFASSLNWSRILVVTSAYHVSRTAEIFSYIYGPHYHVEVRGAKSETGTALDIAETKSLSAFRSTFEGIDAGDDVAIFARLRAAHPFYNGVVHPRI